MTSVNFNNSTTPTANQQRRTNATTTTTTTPSSAGTTQCHRRRCRRRRLHDIKRPPLPAACPDHVACNPSNAAEEAGVVPGRLAAHSKPTTACRRSDPTPPASSECDATSSSPLLLLKTFPECKLRWNYQHHQSQSKTPPLSSAWSRRVLVVVLVYSLLGLTVTPAHAVTCSEPGPINILARAISSSPSVSRLLTVVSDKNGIKGYEVDSFEKSLRLLKVGSDEIFTECDFFPAEFSVIATVKRTEYDSKASTSHYVMSLLAPGRTVLLGFRLQRDRIVFEVRYGNRTHIVAKDERLLDGQWHTVVVTVSHKEMTVYLDCDKLKTSKLERPFPARMNVRRTSFHVGSVGRKIRLFKGVLRQVMVIAGSDASLIICPSPNPSIASIYQTKATPKPPSGATITLEEAWRHPAPACTKARHGSMLISKRRELKVCTMNGYQSVRSPRSERLDYIIDFEDINTIEKTRSIEWFHIPGDNFYLVTANTGSMSEVFVWKDDRFASHHKLDTNGAHCFKYFEIGDRPFLAVANLGAEKDYDPTEAVNSSIFRWSRAIKKFILHQQIQTWRARSVEVFPVEDSYFLVVVDQRTNGNKNVYYWSDEKEMFKPFQFIPTKGPLDVTYFFIGYNTALFSCFVVANALYKTESQLMSEIFCYEDNHFVSKQIIMTSGAADWEFFKIKEGKDNYRYFLAVANAVKYVDGNNNNMIESTIYELHYLKQEFLPYQSILTNGWKGVEKFQPVHELPIGRVTDIDYIPINGRHYLAAASPCSTMSKLYRIITY